MPKVTTSLVDGYYYPKILTKEEVEEYEKLGYEPIEIDQETINKWNEHCKQINLWHKFWSDIDEKMWNDV